MYYSAASLATKQYVTVATTDHYIGEKLSIGKSKSVWLAKVKVTFRSHNLYCAELNWYKRYNDAACKILPVLYTLYWINYGANCQMFCDKVVDFEIMHVA